MALQPFFTYYGGKWRAAPHYPVPEHDTVIEPFAGSAGYALRHPNLDIRLYDIDPIICGVWDYILKASESEILALPDVETTVDDLIGIPQEARWLIGLWLNKGAASPRKSPSAWMRSGMCPNSYWGGAIRERIARQQQHVRHWRVENASFEDIPQRPATWFVDPPYEQSGKHYVHGAAGIDFASLGQWCKQRWGQVIVCENEGATWLPFEQFRSIKATPGATRLGVSKELVWVNESSIPTALHRRLGGGV